MGAMTQPPGDSESDQPTDPSGQGAPGYAPPGHGQAGYGQPGYGPPPPGYAPTPYQPFVPPPTHGQGLASMILGIVSLVLCFGYGIGLLGSPVAWWLGAKSLKEIDSAPGQYSGRGFAQTGQILGIVGTVLLGVLLLLAIVVLVIVVVVQTGGTGGGGPETPAQSF
jgi:hypothetical protein